MSRVVIDSDKESINRERLASPRLVLLCLAVMVGLLIVNW